MFFTLLIRNDPELMEHMEPSDFVALAAGVDAFDGDLTEAGANLGSVRLAAEARVIRLRGGKPFTTDGPFPESTEQIGGIYLIEAGDFEAATLLAERLVGTKLGSIELRTVLGVDLHRIVFHESAVE